MLRTSLAHIVAGAVLAALRLIDGDRSLRNIAKKLAGLGWTVRGCALRGDGTVHRAVLGRDRGSTKDPHLVEVLPGGSDQVAQP